MGEGEARLTMPACSAPPEGQAQWTLQLLADRLVALTATTRPWPSSTTTSRDAHRRPRQGDRPRRASHDAKDRRDGHGTLRRGPCPGRQGHAPETLGIPGATDRERDAAGGFAEGLDKVHGRLERRSIRVTTPPKGLASHPGVRRVARVTRCREPLGKTARDAGTGGRDHAGTECLVTSPGAEKASPEELPALNRGHRAVEGMNRRRRDCAFGEDACLTRTGTGPADRAGPTASRSRRSSPAAAGPGASPEPGGACSRAAARPSGP